MHDDEQTWTIVLAAGRGERFGDAKQFAQIAGDRAVDRAVATARAASDGVVVVLPAGTAWKGSPVDRAVTGGTTRAGSVRCGLQALPAAAAVVVIHDAAHPLASVDLLRRVASAVRSGADAAVPVLRIAEAVGVVVGDRLIDRLPKDRLVLLQTPCAFRRQVLEAAHADEPEAEEDTELVLRAGGVVLALPGEPGNAHVVEPGDITRLERAITTG